MWLFKSLEFYSTCSATDIKRRFIKCWLSGCRDGSTVKSTYCSLRVHRVSSLHPCQAAHSCLYLHFQRIWCPLASSGTYKHLLSINLPKNTYTHKNKRVLCFCYLWKVLVNMNLVVISSLFSIYKVTFFFWVWEYEKQH